jgi:hypothetical protein
MKIKSLIKLALVAAAAIVISTASALAQLGNPLVVINSDGGTAWTNRVYGTQTASNTAVNLTKIAVPKGTRNVGLEFTGHLTGAGTDPVNIVLGRNISGSTNIEPFLVWAWVPAGAAYKTQCTNLYDGSLGSPIGFPNLYVMYLTNSGAGSVIMTNYTLRASFN